MPLSETQITQFFKCTAVKKATCGACTSKLTNFKWSTAGGVQHTYGADVYISWSNDSNYRRVYAGGASNSLNEFTTVQALANFINNNHTI